MIYRREYIENSLSLDDSGTKTWDLNFVDPVSNIELMFEATNGASGNKENPILHNVTKIEVVDGGDVVTSIRGEVLRGMVSHLDGQIPGRTQTEIFNGTPRESVTIPFGRYVFDEDYAFNPVAFRNPQLKITWDLAHVRAVGATGYVTGSLIFTAVANIMEGAGPPSGVLTAKEVYDFTSAASGDEKVDIPTDYPIRVLGVRAYENGVWIGSTVSTLKLAADGNKVVFFDEDTRELMQRQLDYYGELRGNRISYFDSGDYVATYMAHTSQGVVSGNAAQARILATTYFLNSDARMIALTDAGAAASNAQAYVQVHGTAYENCIMVPFGRKDFPNTWLQTSGYGSLVLYITQANAGGEVQVFVQEARPY